MWASAIDALELSSVRRGRAVRLESRLVSDPSQLERRLTGLLARIFSAGVVSDEERVELQAALTQTELEPERVQVTIRAFVEASFEQFKANGTISDRERDKLVLIVRELRLSDSALPPGLLAVLERPA